MTILGYLKKLAVKLERKNNSIFTYPVYAQQEYMNSLKAPNNDIERSYNQYCCQMKLNNKLMSVLLNIVSLPMIFVYYLKKNDAVEYKKCDAVFISEGIPDNVIPNELKEEYVSWVNVTKHGERLSARDKIFFNEIVKKHPFSWHFLLKCLIKIRFYSYEIKCHSPKTIVVCGEYSFTSSVLTYYCNYNDVLHIDVMHGEKLFYMRDSFFHFDRCYVWDKYYLNLFLELHAEKKQFIVAIPSSMRINIVKNVSKIIDFTFYLAAEENEALTRILHNLQELSKRGYKVAVRPHPRYSDAKKIKELCCGDIEVEDTQKITIEESVLRTRNAISGYSTVLNQAYHNGTKVVIDDITNPDSFNKLVELKYVMLETEHKLLSELLEEIR